MQSATQRRMHPNMKKATVLGVTGLGVACLFLWGCPNPNSIGVQTFGSVQVTCLQASNNQPIAGAIATISGSTGPSTNSRGQTVVPNVPIGTNVTAVCDAPGLSGTNTIPSIVEGSNNSVTISMSPS